MRDVRRTVRQGMWMAVGVSVPIWIVLWQSEAILLAMGQQPALAKSAAEYVRALQWSLLPFFFFLVLRSFVSALERPLWALAAGVAGVVANAAMTWCLIFGHLGFPRLGLVGAGIATSLADTLMFVLLAAVILTDSRFRRYHLRAASGAPTGRASANSGISACRSARPWCSRSPSSTAPHS